MARTTLAVQVATVAGLAVTMSTPSGSGTGNGNKFTSKKGAIAVLLVKNGDSGAHVITIPANGKKVQGVLYPDFTKSVAAGATALIWVPPDLYADVDGIVGVDIDGTTSVTWAALKIPAVFA